MTNLRPSAGPGTSFTARSQSPEILALRSSDTVSPLFNLGSPPVSPGENLATCLEAQAEDVAAAAEAARAVLENWSGLPGASRAKHLTR